MMPPRKGKALKAKAAPTKASPTKAKAKAVSNANLVKANLARANIAAAKSTKTVPVKKPSPSIPVKTKGRGAGKKKAVEEEGESEDEEGEGVDGEEAGGEEAAGDEEDGEDGEDGEGSSSDSDEDELDEAVVAAINTAAAAISKKFAAASSSSFSSSSSSKPPSNELTHLIPGYTAPLSLTSGLESTPLYISYTAPQPLDKDVKKRAAAFTSDPAATMAGYAAMEEGEGRTGEEGEALTSEALTSSSTAAGEAADHIMKNGIKKKPPSTSAPSGPGAGWFGFTSQLAGYGSVRARDNSEALQKDLQVIRMRNYLDPKKFYKSSDKPSPHAQLGTVISNGAEYFSSRLTKAERRSTLLEEVMADESTRRYAKKQMTKIQKGKESGGKKWRRGMEKKREKDGNAFRSRKKTF